VRVHEGATGEEVGGTRWGHTNVGPLLKRISRQPWARLGSAIEGARPAPVAAPAPAGRSNDGASSTESEPAEAAVDGRIVTVFITPPVRLMGEMRRFFFDMRPEPGDARVAGGAVDEVWSAGLELGWRY
jgi:hypothetical protein